MLWVIYIIIKDIRLHLVSLYLIKHYKLYLTNVKTATVLSQGIIVKVL